MMTRESLIEWAASWVPDNPPGQRQRFADSLAEALRGWEEVPPNVAMYLRILRRFDDAIAKIQAATRMGGR
jgi:hypothetical protein